jgi:TonB family protein
MAGVFLAALQAAAVLAGPSGAAPPRLLNEDLIRFDDYPSSSIINEEFGVVSVLLRVATDGKVTACDVTESSGFQTLDKTTCSLLKMRARFNPAKNADGATVDGEYRAAAIWALPPHIPPQIHKVVTLQVSKLPTDYAAPVQARLLLDGSGHVATCEVTASSGSATADSAACSSLQKFTVPPPKSGSNAVPAMAVRYLTVEFSVRP